MKSHETSRLQLPTLFAFGWICEPKDGLAVGDGKGRDLEMPVLSPGLCPSLLSTHTGLSFLEHLGLLPIIFPISGVLHQLSCLLSIFSSVPLFSPSFPLFLQLSDPNTSLTEPSVIRRPSVNSYVTLNCSSEANFTVLWSFDSCLSRPLSLKAAGVYNFFSSLLILILAQ